MAARLYFVLLIIFGCWQGLEAQNIQLYSENFNSTIPQYDLNSTVGPFPPAGPNQWVINSNYSGGALYPNTIRQDSTHAGGTIAGAPFSRYIHIHDSQVAPGIANANFDPAIASDNFAIIDESICTKSITDVIFSFFYLCEGNANAYGELYYSRNGGPWTKVGANQYQGQGKWKYEEVQDPAFDDVQDLRFGFRWINSGGSGPKSTSFSIDDIIVVGTYDPQTNPLDITVTGIFSNPVCKGDAPVALFSVSDTVCWGTYRFWLSEPGGSFSNPINLGTITINNLHVFGGANLITNWPSNILLDTCYKIRVDRMAPPPIITGTASFCFEVVDCPHVITTRAPVALSDPSDTICVGSAIDVPFNSTGFYESNNAYTAQLSDSNGSFANPFIIGSVPDPNDYPAIPPGNVSGLIPNNVPPGCGYRIRIVSSSPSVIGSEYGPFCIRDCDMTTNKQQDIHVCIDESTGVVDTVYVDIHEWSNNAQYYLGNQFSIELRSRMDFSFVNLGGLGATFDTASTSFLITIPPLPDLFSLGIAPGAYYMRIFADSTSTPYDDVGTLVRLTIGAPSENPATVYASDSAICTGQPVTFGFFPENPQSDYKWQSPVFNNGDPFEANNPFGVGTSGFAGEIRMRVQETNFGCVGAWSDYVVVVVATPPNVNITGDNTACLGDTILYTAPFEDNTYYKWTPPLASSVLDTTNNEARLRWDSVGTFIVQVRVVNPCAADVGFREVSVYDYPNVDLGPDRTVCKGEEVRLVGDGNQGNLFWVQDLNIVSRKDTFSFIADDSLTYQLFIANPGCISRDTIMINIEEPEEVQEDSIDFCKGDSTQLDAGLAGIGYQWNTGDTSQVIIVSDPGDYVVTLLDPAKACKTQRRIIVETYLCSEPPAMPNAFTPNGDNLNDKFGLLGEEYVLNYLRIYNRWGELVFETMDGGEEWDGTYLGEPADLGVYTWVVSYVYDDEPIVKSGNVTLIR